MLYLAPRLLCNPRFHPFARRRVNQRHRQCQACRVCRGRVEWLGGAYHSPQPARQDQPALE